MANGDLAVADHGPCVGTLEGPTRAEVEAVRGAIESVTQQLAMAAVLTTDGIRVEVLEGITAADRIKVPETSGPAAPMPPKN